MTDKEIKNIQEIKEYVDSRETQSTGAYNVWKADVTYESYGLQTQNLRNVEILYQYSDIPQIIINSFNPPYYSVFDPRYQSFKYDGTNLDITGVDNKGNKYKVTIK